MATPAIEPYGVAEVACRPSNTVETSSAGGVAAVAVEDNDIVASGDG